MKTKFTLVLAILVLAMSGKAQTANARIEKTIRDLENSQVESLLRNDLASMERNWSRDYTVNNPFYEVVNAHTGPIRTGKLTYSKFERNVEKVLIHGGTAIVMGAETVVPDGLSPDAGKTIHRRFTNVWMNEKGSWLLVARQASVICSK